MPRTKRTGDLERTHDGERLVRQRPPGQVAAEDDQIDAGSLATSASTASSAVRVAVRRRPARRRASAVYAAAGDRELVLGVADALLDLPAVGRRLAALDRLELGLRRLELLAGAGVVDLGRLDGVVDERDRPVLQHLEEARARSRTRAPRRRREWTRVEPAFSVAISGACRASTPISPAAPGTMIISASPSNAAPSGVTSETENSLRSAIGLRGGAGHLLARSTAPSIGPTM